MENFSADEIYGLIYSSALNGEEILKQYIKYKKLKNPDWKFPETAVYKFMKEHYPIHIIKYAYQKSSKSDKLRSAYKKYRKQLNLLNAEE